MKIKHTVVIRMRVVSGKCKGIPLKAVPGKTTRPTTDKVKEAIFNMIGPYFDGGIGLDLFAGSGGLGIEALSRGLDKMIFVDRDKNAIQTIHENIHKCGLEPFAEVYRNDAERALKAVAKRELRFQLIFLDPPYRKQQLEGLIERISEKNLLHPDGVIICEHESDYQLPERIHDFIKNKEERYGTTTVAIYVFGDV